MPRTTNRNLTLTKVGTEIKVEVTYKAHFSRFERNLAGLGMTFREEVTLFGVDPPNSTTGTQLHVVAVGQFAVTVGNEEQTIEPKHSITVSRDSLNEDPGTFVEDDDEIRCRIRILSIGIPTQSIDAFTNQQVLFEDGGIHPTG